MSTLNVSNITDGTTTVGTSYVVNGAAKAWVNFNGTGTVAIRDSQNVSGLVDNGTGNYDVNYTSNMSASDYSVTTAIGQTSPFPIAQAYLASVSVNFVRLNTAQPGTADYDTGVIASATFGNLA
jgi:hypothetical protein